MAVLGQGLVLMIAGMVIVYCFLGILIVVTQVTMKGVAKFDSLVQQDAPKKPAAKVAGNEDENIALAIAVALG